MAFRDGSNVLVSRQSVLLATAVGMGLLTLVYVLGVQVGKQTTAMRAGAKSTPEDLKELPAPLTEQLKAFEAESAAQEKARSEPPKPAEFEASAQAKAEEKAKPDAKTEAKIPPKAEAKPPAKAEEKPKPEQKADAKAPAKAAAPPPPGERWTQQLVTTTDPAEVKRITSKAKEAGFETVEVKAGDSVKVRLKGIMSKADADGAGAKLKEKGLKPFAVKVD